MVGAERGLSTTRTECANAMRHPGSARCTLSEDAQTLAPFILDFMYQMTIQVCVTQLWIIVFVHAAVTASGDNSSNACLEEAAASKVAMPGSASGVSKAKSGDNNSDASLKEAAETTAPKKATSGSASGAGKPKPAKAKRSMVIVVVAIACACQSLALLSLSIFSMSGLHGELQEQARRNFESSDLGLNDSGAEGWGVLFRAGGPWHDEPANVTWKGQALPATSGRKYFFLHVGAFAGSFGGCGQHLVIPMADDTSDWRAAVLERVRAVDSRLVPFAASMRCTLNGKEVGTACRPEDLQDATLRWRSLGLLGGAPKAQDVDKTKDVDEMKKSELMQYAKNILGVETRRVGPDGNKNLFRAVEDVKHDCKAAQERGQSVNGGVANRHVVRQRAADLGLSQRGTKAQLQARIKDATSRQHTLTSTLAKSTAAKPSCDVSEQCQEQEPLPGSASGHVEPKQPRRKVASKPIHQRNRRVIGAYRATPKTKAAQKAREA